MLRPAFIPLFLLFSTACRTEAPSRPVTVSAEPPERAAPSPSAVASAAPLPDRFASVHQLVTAGKFADVALELRQLEAKEGASERDRAETRLELFKAWLTQQERVSAPDAVCQPAPKDDGRARSYAIGTLRDRRDEARELLRCALSPAGGLDAASLPELLARVDALDARDRRTCSAQGLQAQIDLKMARMGDMLGDGEDGGSVCSPVEPGKLRWSSVDGQMGRRAPGISLGSFTGLPGPKAKP
jgi:hypothetical protein